MLNRENPVWMGKWNGVGGKIEKGENPQESAIREIYEETQIKVDKVDYKGIVTWDSTNGTKGGMYLFMTYVSNIDYKTPILTEEGILDWKDIDWIVHDENNGVVDNIKYFLPNMIEDDIVREYYCEFDGYSLKKVIIK